MQKKQTSNGLYLTRIKRHAHQNNFHKDVLEQSAKYDRLLITDPEAFIEDLKKWVECIHLKHPRAKAMDFEIYKTYRANDDRGFNIGKVLFFTLFIVSGKYTADGPAPYLSFEKGGDHGA